MATSAVPLLRIPYSVMLRISCCTQVKADARASQQFLLLSHLYSQKADAAALARLRKELLRPKYTSLELAMGSALGVGAVGGVPPPSPHPPHSHK